MSIPPTEANVRRARLLAVAVLLISAIAACGDDSGDENLATDDGTISHPSGDDLVVQVRRTGGLRPAGAEFSDVPATTVLGDGTMITQGAQIAIHPAPVLPPLIERELTETGMQRLLEHADAEGLLSPPPHYGQPLIADATTTILTIHAGGQQVTHEIYALGIAPGPDGDGEPSGLTDRQRERRESVASFVEALAGPETLVPPGEVSEESPFRPGRFAIRAQPQQEDDEERSSEVRPETRDWPLPDVDLDAAVDCLEVTGDAADQLAEALADADELTRFRQDETVYEFRVRPLLPNEDGCPIA